MLIAFEDRPSDSPFIESVWRSRSDQPGDFHSMASCHWVMVVTGLTRAAIHQIERARHAAILLRQGESILDVVHEAGYYDQAHLTRSLQRFVGQSPARVAEGREQLSLLSNREDA